MGIIISAMGMESPPLQVDASGSPAKPAKKHSAIVDRFKRRHRERAFDPNYESMDEVSKLFPIIGKLNKNIYKKSTIKSKFCPESKCTDMVVFVPQKVRRFHGF